jgi:predicted DsbA family dithiol-disulfide isomerase
MASVRLEVFTDFVCPWCYLSLPRIGKLKRNQHVDVQWRYFPLHPDTPDEGLLLTELFRGRSIDIEAVHARLKSLMDAEGLQFNERTHTYNSRLAQELAKGFDNVSDALYKAYFVEGKNIGNVDVLVEIAQSVGIPEEDARGVLSDRTFKAAVDADWDLARRYGITGVPTFVAGGRKLVGAHPYDVLERFLVTAYTGS